MFYYLVHESSMADCWYSPVFIIKWLDIIFLKTIFDPKINQIYKDALEQLSV